MKSQDIRIIPTLLLKDKSLIKTKRFSKFQYVGDPCNTVRIFNELEVDELLFLDIDASKNGKKIDFKLLGDIADECFMPLAYGGGIRTLEDAKTIFSIGFEKIVLNTHAYEKKFLIKEIADYFGSQSVIVSIDVKEDLFKKKYIYTKSGNKKIKKSPVNWAKEVEALGAGEILLTSINREGTWNGFDLSLIRSVSNQINIPLIAHGGAGDIKDIIKAVSIGNATAVGLGNLVIFQKKGMGVLVNYPTKEELKYINESIKNDSLNN